MFSREYIGEPFLNPFRSYPDMETKYPIEIIDLRHQTDHLTPKKIQLFQEHNTNPDIARLFLILIRRREIELISDRNKSIEFKVTKIKKKWQYLVLENCLRNYTLNDDTMNESELQRISNYPMYPRYSKKCSDRGFVNEDNGSQGGTHWTCFIKKNKKSHYFDSFGGAPDEISLNHSPKPITYHK